MQKYVNLVDFVKSFPTNIFLQKSASIQPRTSPSKPGGKFNSLSICLLRHDIGGKRSELISLGDAIPEQIKGNSTAAVERLEEELYAYDRRIPERYLYDPGGVVGCMVLVSANFERLVLGCIEAKCASKYLLVCDQDFLFKLISLQG